MAHLLFRTCYLKHLAKEISKTLYVSCERYLSPLARFYFKRCIGALKNHELGQTPLEDNAILVALQGNVGNCKTFSRCQVNGKVEHSISYKRVLKRNNYTVCYKNIHGNISYGQVAFFLQNVPICDSLCVSNCNFHKPSYWAVILKLQSLDEAHSVMNFNQEESDLPIRVSHPEICLVKPCSEAVEAVLISHILDVLMFINIDDCNAAYVCHSPNKIEKD